jgi:hypothetical protein
VVRLSVSLIRSLSYVGKDRFSTERVHLRLRIVSIRHHERELAVAKFVDDLVKGSKNLDDVRRFEDEAYLP